MARADIEQETHGLALVLLSNDGLHVLDEHPRRTVGALPAQLLELAARSLGVEQLLDAFTLPARHAFSWSGLWCRALPSEAES